MKSKTLKYEGLTLPENLNYILEQDFWMLPNINGMALTMLNSPMKFTSTTSIFVRKGSCRFEINLRKYYIEAPCVVNIASSDIMQPLSISEDFEGAFGVMSSRFVADFLKTVGDESVVESLRSNPIMKVPVSMVSDFEFFFNQIRALISEKDGRYIYRAVLHTLVAFVYHKVLKCVDKDRAPASTAAHITNRFFQLARENFKKERFMEFYARELEITPKHLSRTLKAQTGFSASEWIDKMIILEAKVLLKSSSMSIGQIADELNFTTQSFFGKYFKNQVGVSPKEFRNG